MKEARHKITYNRIPFIENPKTGDKKPTLFGDSYVSGRAIKKTKTIIITKVMTWVTSDGEGVML